jgi:hypothetical protein
MNERRYVPVYTTSETFFVIISYYFRLHFILYRQYIFEFFE